MAMITTASLEPLYFGEHIPSSLTDLAFQIQKEAAAFERELPKAASIRKKLRETVQVMNCYYSNLIEGNHTRPKDIINAMGADIISGKGDIKLHEAMAHIRVQAHIDRQAYDKALPDPASLEFIKDLHRRFYEDEGESERLEIKGPDGRRCRIRPGYFREKPEENVQVGLHTPPESSDVQAFMEYFSERYMALMKTSPTARIIGIAAAHHRLNYIHPFLDGNGRVTRLVSHAMFRRAGIGVGGLWSISRGLARGLKGQPRSEEYKQYMMRADRLRDGALDGRGTLSLKALTEFCEWFLSVALDQIIFMRGKFDAAGLEKRYLKMVTSFIEGNIEDMGSIIRTIFLHGELQRADLPLLLKCSDKTARNRITPLISEGFVFEDPHNKRAPYQLDFPIKYSEMLFPELF